MSFGSTLKQAREALGLSTQELSMRTKIRGDYLRALEDGNIALLPERTFARSYLQRYARELNLDPTPLIADFDRSVPPTPEIAQSLRGASSTGRAPTGVSPALLAGALTAVIVVGAGGYYAYNTYMKPPPALAATPAPTPAVVTTPAAPAPAPAPAPTPTTVRLTVKSVPSGARVYLDNRDLGTTPLNVFPVDQRDRAELRVELGGRQPLRQSIALTGGRYLRATLPAAGSGPSTLTDLNRPGSAPAVTPAATATPGTPATTGALTAPRAAVSVTFAAPSWTRVTGPGGKVLYQGTPPAGSVKGFPKGVVIRAGNAGGVRVSVNGAAAAPMGQSGQVVTRAY